MVIHGSRTEAVGRQVNARMKRQVQAQVVTGMSEPRFPECGGGPEPRHTEGC